MSNAGSIEELRAVVEQLQEEIAQLRGSRRRLVEGAHADRRAIERDLHDGVQQHLVALAVGLRRLGGLPHGDAAAAKALLADMAANVREALDEATTLATRVYPPMLEGRGFASALRSAANNAGVAAHVDVPASAGFPPVVLTAVYWTWVEALASASRGSQASVSVNEEHGVLSFAVTIDGHQPEANLDRLGDRIEALDGRLSVDDRQEGGSRVHGWLPLSR